MPTTFEVASVVTEFPITARSVLETQFTWEDIERMALAMHHQGTWFMGREVRTPESAWTVARDLLIALELIGFQVVPHPESELARSPENLDGPQEVERIQVTRGQAKKWRYGGSVPGQAGNSR